jgi:hypothetical protein
MISEKKTKVVCIGEYKQLKGVLDLGDEVIIESILTDEERIISWKYNIVKDSSGNPIKNIYGHLQYLKTDIPDQIEPKGNYVDYRFKSKNGGYYTGRIITGAIGYGSMNKLFKKI